MGLIKKQTVFYKEREEIMNSTSNCRIFVKYDLYEGELDRCKKKTHVYSAEKSIEEAKKNLSTPAFKFKDRDCNFYCLVDLTEVVVDGHSYKITGGLCCGEAVIEKIDKIVKTHLEGPTITEKATITEEAKKPLSFVKYDLYGQKKTSIILFEI